MDGEQHSNGFGCSLWIYSRWVGAGVAACWWGRLGWPGCRGGRVPGAPGLLPLWPGGAGLCQCCGVEWLKRQGPDIVCQGPAVWFKCGRPQPWWLGPRPNGCPAVTYSPTPSRVQYHRRCGS